MNFISLKLLNYSITLNFNQITSKKSITLIFVQFVYLASNEIKHVTSDGFQNTNTRASGKILDFRGNEYHAQRLGREEKKGNTSNQYPGRSRDSVSLVPLSFSQQERSSIILYLSSMHPGTSAISEQKSPMVADNAIRGQLHSLMDLPHIIVTYTYVSFVKTISTNVHSACLPTVRKNEIDILSMVVVSFRCHHTLLRLSPSSSFAPRFRARRKTKKDLVRVGKNEHVVSEYPAPPRRQPAVQMKIIPRFRPLANQSITMRSTTCE